MSRILRKALRRTPVAWMQLSHNPVKLAVGLAGVSFSNLLMFFQLGLLDSVYNSQRKPIDHLRAELVLVSSGYSNLGALQTFDRSRLFQCLGAPGVEGVSAMRAARGSWVTPENHNNFHITVFGVNLLRPSFNFSALVNNPQQLQPLRTALFDRDAKEQYGPVPRQLKERSMVPVQVNKQQVRIIGTFALGATFAADANLIVSDNTFLTLFPQQDPRRIQLGLIQLRPGADPAAVQQALQPLMKRDVKVLTRQQLADLEVRYWERHSAVGFIFSLGVLVGFLVGSIIVYQILFGDVMSSLPQYATLKAMGYTDRYVISVVIQQSALLAFVGFIPGVLVSAGLYLILANATKLAVAMSFARAAQVLLLTFVMCVGSGALATRKLTQLDPADIF